MSKKNEAYPVVLITGAAKRIGAELARLFSTNGFTCIIHYKRKSSIKNSNKT